MTLNSTKRVNIYSFNCLHHNRFIFSKKWDLHTVRYIVGCFNFQYPLFSSKSSSSSLCLLPRLPVTSSPIFHSITRSSRQYLRKIWPIQLTFLLLILCRTHLSSLTHITLSFSRDRSSWSIPSLFSTIFQNFPGISNLVSEISKFQRHTKLRSECTTSLAHVLNQYMWWQILIRYIVVTSVQPGLVHKLCSDVGAADNFHQCQEQIWGTHSIVSSAYKVLRRPEREADN
jgi:hypothetical protein